MPRKKKGFGSTKNMEIGNKDKIGAKCFYFVYVLPQHITLLNFNNVHILG